MKSGNWVPMRKTGRWFLPKDRPYSGLEALYSLQNDYDEGNSVSVAGYSALWGWSRKRVGTFLNKVGVKIEYPKDTAKIQNQRGQIAPLIGNRSEGEGGQIIFCIPNGLDGDGNRSEDEGELIGDRSGSTTKETIQEVKDLSKDKSRKTTELSPGKEEKKAPSAPPSGGPSKRKKRSHYSTRIDKPHLKDIEKECLDLERLSRESGKNFNPWQYVQRAANECKHPGAILEVLRGLSRNWPGVNNPWAVANKIMSKKNGNYNERDHVRQAQEFKTMVVEADSIRALLSGIGE